MVWQRLNTPTCGVDRRIVRDQVYDQGCVLPSGQVLNSVNGPVVTRLWSGQHAAVTVGNGSVLTVPQEFSRILDVYGRPGT